MVAAIGSASAQYDDLYFVPKKKVKVENSADASSLDDYWEELSEEHDESEELSVTTTQVNLIEMDEDTYNRRGLYLTGQSEAMENNLFALITEDGDTMWVNTDTLNLAVNGLAEDEGWVGGFDGSESDYEYAMRIIRFRNPRYAIPVSSPLYWDVVYGGALWPSWEWNVYDDGMYAYVFPTTSNWYYWDYRVQYPFGWNNPWGYPYNYYGYYRNYPFWHYHGYYTWHDSWHHPFPHFKPIGGYNPRPVHRPGLGTNNPGKPGGSSLGTLAHRRPVASSTRHSGSDSRTSGSRVSTSSSRTSRPTTQRTQVNTPERTVGGRPSTPSSASRPTTPSRSRYTGSDEKVERGTSGSPSISRGSSTSRSRASTSRTSQSVDSGASSSRSSSSSLGSGSSSRTSYGSGSSHSSSSRSSSYGGGGSRGGSRR